MWMADSGLIVEKPAAHYVEHCRQVEAPALFIQNSDFVENYLPSLW